MDRVLSDERLAELRALQQKRIEGRGGVPEVRDLVKALDELTALRAEVNQLRAKWSSLYLEVSDATEQAILWSDRAGVAEDKLARLREYAAGELATTREDLDDCSDIELAYDVASKGILSVIDGSDT